MPLSTISNGASSATARTAINAAITQLNGSSAPIVTPNIIHVTTEGNDSTGDGSMAKPYRTLQHAYPGSVESLIKLGVGSFSATVSEWSPLVYLEANALTTVTIQSTGNIELIANGGLTISPSSIGADGQDGENGTSEQGDGQVGQPGNNSGYIKITGNCIVVNPTSSGGNGGRGGNGVFYDDGSGNASAGNGGQGGNGGNPGIIVLKVTGVRGAVTCSVGSGGVGGTNAGSGSASNGSDGTPSSAPYLDGAYAVEATFPNGWSASRCSYAANQAPPYPDYGGNAAI